MATKNIALSQLNNGSTYNEIFNRDIIGKVKLFQASYPQKKIYMMGWGDTSQPLPATVVRALIDGATKLGNLNTYTGYEDINGNPELKKSVCDKYYQEKIGVEFDSSEIFISDGAQSSLSNLQELFGLDNSVALQNPTYPAFIEGNSLAGRSQFIELHCHEQNNFVPQTPQEKVDLIYLCFPNNPTGAVATKEQLKGFVDYARSHQAVIIFDAVYSWFVNTPNIPRSIYEIEGAKECAIEINSFSKIASFTGLRLGWSVVPHSLTIKNTTFGELNQMWSIRNSIKFWGASNLAQQGGIAVLSAQGQKECQQNINYYLTNAHLLRQGLSNQGFNCFGGTDNPFIWLKAPGKMTSWQFFDNLLQEMGIVGIPGCLFGESGEGYLRLSALASQKEIAEAVQNRS
ncbi:LL-diaminopimelate aminotransferase [Anabaena sp. UHCC 0187]|uniref:LL-diaminopimelate aminotransferase n=1 Tax=Anabaena sp. UHCC 0187 TaxID=2590018 RepID=UPI00144840DC|nr:LL-diaminopimelate aminotransferase [Anabaena sp. UHCC 0187]MDP5018079.1 LL-diaminopimelate aminotransferase [Dolichospermum sp.]MTJ12583.1 LL-diaminopimelate aminotransferase [Anabaena sp. UHCC 0187]